MIRSALSLRTPHSALRRLSTSGSGPAKRPLKPEQLTGVKETAEKGSSPMPVPASESGGTPWFLITTVGFGFATAGVLYKAKDDVDVSFVD